MSTPDLKIATDLCMPLDSVSQTFAILAKRGVGKTYTASVLAEELLKAGLHTVIADPVGVWWGLRSNADGTGPGLPIVILGGDHGDVPLEPGAGELIADLVVDERLSCVLDLSNFTQGEQVRFMQAFAERLYLRNRQPLQLVLDEADAFAPQSPMPDERRMLGAVEKLVRRGRARGIGVTLITQRAAVLNKSVLTQVEVLIALRTIGPQDRKAIDTWISAHGTEEQRHELLSSLPSLAIGEAWFWSPAWLDVFQRVKVRRRETFDSSATPKVGAERVQPKILAEVDLAQLRDRIAATMEAAEAEDPKVLRRRIADLESQLASRPTAPPVVERVEVPVLRTEDIARLEAAVSDIVDTGAALTALGRGIQDCLRQFSAPPAVLAAPPQPPDPEEDVPSTEEEPAPGPAGQLRAGERRMLQAIARLHPLPLTRPQLGTLAQFSPSGGTFGTYLSTLRRAGYVHDDGRTLSITSAGLEYLGPNVPRHPQTTQELLQLWRSALRAGERKMLDELVRSYPGDLTRNELGRRTGFAVSGGTFGTYLSTLRRNGLATVSGSKVRASESLFLSGGPAIKAV